MINVGVIQSALVKACSREDSQSLSAIIKRNAETYSLDPKLIACIIYQESGGEEEAYRFEDEFYERHYAGYVSSPPTKNKKDLVGYLPTSTPTFRSELRARSASWGCMQILGETVRLMGCTERWLPIIRKNQINVELGCKYLRHLSDKAVTISTEAERLFKILTWWNGSTAYPPLIIDHLGKEKWRAILQ